MADTNLVPAPEALPVVMAECAVDAGMPIFITIIYVRRPVVSEILACTLDAIMKTAPSCILKLVWWLFPSAMRTILVARGRRRWALLILGASCCGGEQADSSEGNNGEYRSTLQGITSFVRSSATYI